MQSKVEKAIKEVRNKKATGDDYLPEVVLIFLGEGAMNIMTKLINTICERGEWPRDFSEVTEFGVLSPLTRPFNGSIG